MTAEVAILNSGAIAIAADSAVTIGRGRKIYNSALKVFTLSKTAPVGVMVYGSAGLLGVPWETIIKIYRSELKTTTFPKLEDYAAHFLDFLPRQERFFPKPLQDAWSKGIIAGYLVAIRDDFIKAVEAKLRKDGTMDEEAAKQLFERALDSHHSKLSKLPFLKGMNKQWETSFRRRVSTTLKSLIEEVFQATPITKGQRVKLAEIAAFVHARDVISDDHSGVVICGFGDDDIYPVIATSVIDGVFEGRLKYAPKSDKTFRIANANDCSIIPFAQDDMVASFMEGVNPNVNRFTQRYLRQMALRLPELLPDSSLVGDDAARAATKAKLKDDAKKLLDGFFEQLNVHKRKEHVDPILSMVRVLPKDELAAMAEALVSLTAFKRRMTDELETVGGPIDVAVISKGDGFVWVKRKHYFPREFNQHFFANYFRGVIDAS
jgi:hypothetical protein